MLCLESVPQRRRWIWVSANVWPGCTLESMVTVRCTAAGMMSAPIMLHQGGMQCPILPSSTAHTDGHAAIGGREQGSGTAGKISHAQVCDGSGSGPVRRQSGYGQLRQQQGGGEQDVEGGQDLAVGNQEPEYLSRYVLGRGGSLPCQALNWTPHVSQDVLTGRIGQNIADNSKDRPLVNLQDTVPDLQGVVRAGLGCLAHTDPGNARLSLNGGMEDHGIGQNGDGHAVGLRDSCLVHHLAQVCLDRGQGRGRTVFQK